MSRLIREEKRPRSPFAPKLTAEQEAARVKQSKADRKKIMKGIVLRAAGSNARWAGLKPKRGVSKSETRMQMAARIFGANP